MLDRESRPKPDTTYGFVFQVFDQESGGTMLGQPIARELKVVNGTFGVGIPLSTFDDNKTGNYWLDVTVNGESLTPRVRVGVVPYALRSRYTDGGNIDARSPLAAVKKAEGTVEVQLNQQIVSQVPEVSISYSPDNSNGIRRIIAECKRPAGIVQGDRKQVWRDKQQLQTP